MCALDHRSPVLEQTGSRARPYPIVGRSVDEGQLFAMSVKGSRRSIRADIHPTQGSSVAPLLQGRTVRAQLLCGGLGRPSVGYRPGSRATPFVGPRTTIDD